MSSDTENIIVGKIKYSGYTSDYYARTSSKGAQDPRYQLAKAAEDALKVQKAYDVYSRGVTLRNTLGSDIGTLNAIREQYGLGPLKQSEVKTISPITPVITTTPVTQEIPRNNIILPPIVQTSMITSHSNLKSVGIVLAVAAIGLVLLGSRKKH